MSRRILPAVLLAMIVLGCAGPAKLAQRSEDKLAQGEMWRAWTLATRALDKAPGNTQARAAATRAAAAIADDWQRRIRALAEADSLAAAEQVLEFVTFRAAAARYTTVPVGAGWTGEERALRGAAARNHYQGGVADLDSRRPKRAYLRFLETERFVSGYRDAAQLADQALEKAVTRVAFVPLQAASGGPGLGREVAASWRGDVVQQMAANGSPFTRVLPVEDVERVLNVSQLGRLSRDDAVRLGRRAGADRIVWGSIGNVASKTRLHFFSDRIARRIEEKDGNGRRTTRWVEVPIDVISRVRDVAVDVEYEVIATKGGVTLARRQDTRTMSARVVWTTYSPEGSPDSYALVSEAVRTAQPDRAKQVETKWKDAVGAGTTIAQVLEAKRASSKKSNDRREVIGRLLAGTAFVMMEELPSAEDLGFAACAGGWKPVYQDLARLGELDDVDLGVAAETASRR